jgi:hypothetical protein
MERLAANLARLADRLRGGFRRADIIKCDVSFTPDSVAKVLCG